MMDKKGQGGLSMNTIIIAIIGIIVLLLIVTFFTGGMSTIFGKIRDVFSGGTAGFDVDLAKANCQAYCERAKLIDRADWSTTTYCTKTFKIENDAGNLEDQTCKDSTADIFVPCKVNNVQIC